MAVKSCKRVLGVTACEIVAELLPASLKTYAYQICILPVKLYQLHILHIKKEEIFVLIRHHSPLKIL